MKKKNIVIRYFMLLVLIATLNDDFLKSFQITVETYKGIVQLTGFVKEHEKIDGPSPQKTSISFDAKDNIESAAQRIIFISVKIELILGVA